MSSVLCCVCLQVIFICLSGLLEHWMESRSYEEDYGVKGSLYLSAGWLVFLQCLAQDWTECTPFVHLFREYRPEYERLRRTLNPHGNLCLREKAQNKQKREQLEHLWKDMGSVCVQGSTLAGPDASAMGPSELILTRGTLDEEQEERESDADGIDHEEAQVEQVLK
ncbi:GPN-loop GTPase 1-like [Manacus candei]|uniref:GPN-loop GTPase 1-like n=1 Tax=Manacus candei TaxID=415023 RepID=UPI0022263F85|nr:GPN-loop GTPase 1-like [Manacus candei]